jgi:alkylhydroperoxidase family enzyme
VASWNSNRQQSNDPRENFRHTAVLKGYLALDGAYEKGSFTPRERQIILLAASVENNCNYCTAAHST